MENEEKIITPLLVRLEKQFSMRTDNLPATPDISLIKEMLTNRIIELMNRDYPKFLNALYLLDISEEKIVSVLYKKEKEKIPGLIADLVIERQIQKIITQNLYKEGKL